MEVTKLLAHHLEDLRVPQVGNPDLEHLGTIRNRMSSGQWSLSF